jgi:AcrR family transcriptional regulator
MPGEKPGSESRQVILDAVTCLLRERRAGDATIDDVAKRASCAKGLVHYHFKRKDQLMAAAAAQLWEARSRAWAQALDRPDPSDSIGSAWHLLTSEASTGTAAACAALGFRSDNLVVRSVNEARASFSRSLTAALDGLLARMNLTPSVPASELGTLLGATAEGIALQLASGADQAELEQAWAAFWVGLLSLTGPKRS